MKRHKTVGEWSHHPAGRKYDTYDVHNFLPGLPTTVIIFFFGFMLLGPKYLSLVFQNEESKGIHK